MLKFWSNHNYQIIQWDLTLANLDVQFDFSAITWTLITQIVFADLFFVTWKRFLRQTSKQLFDAKW